MKILVNTPKLNLVGGVANHYLGLKNFWSENVCYNEIGRRKNYIKNGIFWLPYDIIKFIFKLLFFRPDVVLLNPSLGHTALKRDFIFLNIAHFLKFKVAVFIHGFDCVYAEKIDKRWCVNNLNKSALIFILAESFRNQLKEWGVKTNIVLSTTKVDDGLLKNYNPKIRNGEIRNILFLSRITKSKGVYIVIDTYELLIKKYPYLTLTIVGGGEELDNVKKYISKKSLSGINVTGPLTGDSLINVYRTADLYFFPTYYGEGMPTTVLEAMAFGLPVITRPVGGLADFFNEKMGFISETKDCNDYLSYIEKLIESRDKAKEISFYNSSYAKDHFMASKVALNIENYLSKL